MKLGSKIIGRRRRHGYGSSSNPTYSKYQAMKQRCLNSNHVSYPNYGGRGIKVCDRWLNSFSNFLADMGESPKGMSIERDDTNGDYEPGNCHWATKQEQSENTRANIRVIHEGVTYPTLKLACDALGLSYGTVRVRIASYGWSIERALSAPIAKTNRVYSKRRVGQVSQ